MDLEARKINFVQEFLRIENENIINSLENLLRKSKSELFEDNLSPMSLEQFHADIDKALDDSENDRMIKATDLKAKIEKWS
jgi:hypothetical protein